MDGPDTGDLAPMYQGWVVENVPGRLIYHLTSAKLTASLARRMGANTAGVGVCFLSKHQWLMTFRESGLEVLSYAEPDDWVWPLRLEWRLFLHLRQIRVGHVWLRADGDVVATPVVTNERTVGLNASRPSPGRG